MSLRRSYSSLLALFAIPSMLALACDEDQNLVTGGGGSGGSNGGGPSGGSGGGSVECIAKLTAITIAPADTSVTLTGGSAAPVFFTVVGTFEDGSSEELDPLDFEWSVTRADDTDPGSIDLGVLEPNPNAGGVVTVTATDGCVTGSTTVTFFLDVVIGQPENPTEWEGQPTTGAESPAIVYPSDETRFPRNLYRTIFQWRSLGMTEFRLTYEGASSTVTVYTDGQHGLCAEANPVAGCWEVNELTWSYIAGSNAGSTATWTVDGLDTTTDPPTIRRSAPITLGFSREDVEGAIFYWSTTSAGIRRGRISQPDPQDYIVGRPSPTTYDETTEVKCVACHVVSRDGKYLAAPVDASTGKSLWITEVTEDAPPTPLVTQIPETDGHGFATISPDNVHVVAAFAGDMWLLDRATGAEIADISLGTFEAGTHPDWSPAGDEVVFATEAGDSPAGASLAKLAWNGTAFGEPTLLLAPEGDRTLLFPQFSPEGDWIAYATGKGGHGDIQAQLFVIDADGTQAPVEMINANRVTSNAVTDGQYQSSQPTWAPAGDLHWIAFNTKREYGVILPEGTQQIWVAAVDPDKLGTDEDPSYPAFRVPFQGLDENNHRAYWTLDVGDPGSGGGGGGGPGCSEILTVGEPCDPVEDCCETGAFCDTYDSGLTYECIGNVPR
jgi:hypothetical protein